MRPDRISAVLLAENVVLFRGAELPLAQFSSRPPRLRGNWHQDPAERKSGKFRDCFELCSPKGFGRADRPSGLHGGNSGNAFVRTKTLSRQNIGPRTQHPISKDGMDMLPPGRAPFAS